MLNIAQSQQAIRRKTFKKDAPTAHLRKAEKLQQNAMSVIINMHLLCRKLHYATRLVPTYPLHLFDKIVFVSLIVLHNIILYKLKYILLFIII